jgi:hypothetical protein
MEVPEVASEAGTTVTSVSVDSFFVVIVPFLGCGFDYWLKYMKLFFSVNHEK